MNNTAEATSKSRNAVKAARFHRVSKIMSGELTGFGSKVERIVIDPAGKACTNGKIIWIPETMHDNPSYNQIMQEAILAHENAHHRYTDFIAWQRKCVKPTQKGTCDPLLHKFVNMLEDARINHLFGQDWKGSRKRMQFTHEVFMQRHKENTTDDSPLKEQAMVAMMTEAIVHESHWFTTPEVVDFMDANRALLNNAIKQRHTSAVIDQAKRLIKAFRAAFPDEHDPSTGMSSDDLTGQQVEQAAEQQESQGRNPEQVSSNRFKDMKEAEKAEPKEEKKSDDSDSDDSDSDDSESTIGDSDSEGSDSDSEGAGSDGEDSDEESDSEGAGGEGGEDSDSDGDSDSDPMTGDADSEGAETDGDSDGDGEDSDGDVDGDSDSDDGGRGGVGETGTFEEAWADLLDSVDSDVAEIEETALDMDNGIETNATKQVVKDVTEIKGKTVEEDSYSMVTECGHKIEVVATAKDFRNREDNIMYHASTYNRVATQQKRVIKRVTNEMQRRLKGQDPTWETEQKSGRLNPRRAYKLGNAKVHKIDKVYRKKTAPKDVTGNAIILIDASGSMRCGSRASDASNAAVVFSEVFRNIGMNYEVVDFNTQYGTTMRVRKSFASDGTSTLDKACIAAPFTGSANADGYAVQWCLDRLATMNGSRLLIVISDGQPAGASPAGLTDEEHLIQTTENANKKIGLLGIGIAGQDTSRFYPNAITITDESQIAREAMTVLRPMLKRIVPRA